MTTPWPGISLSKSILYRLFASFQSGISTGGTMLRVIFHNNTPIVIGYRGNDGSLMEFVKKDCPDQRRHVLVLSEELHFLAPIIAFVGQR